MNCWLRVPWTATPWGPIAQRTLGQVETGLKLHVLGEAFFPTLVRTGDVSDLRTLDHGVGMHGPSHPWLGLRAAPHSAQCPQEAETVPAPV